MTGGMGTRTSTRDGLDKNIFMAANARPSKAPRTSERKYRRNPLELQQMKQQSMGGNMNGFYNNTIDYGAISGSPEPRQPDRSTRVG